MYKYTELGRAFGPGLFLCVSEGDIFFGRSWNLLQGAGRHIIITAGGAATLRRNDGQSAACRLVCSCFCSVSIGRESDEDLAVFEINWPQVRDVETLGGSYSVIADNVRRMPAFVPGPCDSAQQAPVEGFRHRAKVPNRLLRQRYRFNALSRHRPYGAAWVRLQPVRA